MTARRMSAVLVAVLTAAALTACTDPSPERPEPTTAEPAETAEAEPTQDPEPEFNDVDVEFALATLAHHRQSLDLHQVIQTKSDVPDDVLSLAASLLNGHTNEADEIETLLQSWDVEDEDEQAPEVVTDEDLLELGRAPGGEAAVLYLEAMIANHETTSGFAEDVLTEGQSPEAEQIAQNMLTAQQHELTQMRSMLTELGPADEDDAGEESDA